MRTPEGDGQEGVREATESELRGRIQESRAVGQDATFSNPGATPNLRGVEPNTARTKGFENDADLRGTPSNMDLATGGDSMTDHDDAEANDGW